MYLQDDFRRESQVLLKPLQELSAHLWKQQYEGSLKLPEGLSFQKEVELLELARDALLAECTRHRSLAEDGIADNLHTAVGCLLSANKAAGSLIVRPEDVTGTIDYEEFDHGKLPTAAFLWDDPATESKELEPAGA
jgi:hypothetical protein